MSRTLEQLREVAGLFRTMAESCSMMEAKEALLEVGHDLEEEADQLGQAAVGSSNRGSRASRLSRLPEVYVQTAECGRV